MWVHLFIVRRMMQEKNSKHNREGVAKEKKKGKWNQEQMVKAFRLVVDNHWDIAVAARQCGVPRRTLGDRVNGRVALSAHNGRPATLQEIEEKEIIKWCDKMDDMGFEVGRTEIEEMVMKWKPELKCSDGWWDRFRKRNPELVLRKTQKMDRMRSGALNENVIGLL